eukprot:4147301-Prorocentrum_lima.AAC.1
MADLACSASSATRRRGQNPAFDVVPGPVRRVGHRHAIPALVVHQVPGRAVGGGRFIEHQSH